MEINKSELRINAEKIVAIQKEAAEASLEEINALRLLHELKVHQIELEMQNEELRLANEKLAEIEAAMHRSEQRLTNLFDRASDAIYIVEAETGRIHGCNLQACHDLGYSREELLKLSVTDIESKLLSAEVSAVHHDLLSEKVKTVEGIHKRKDGSLFPVEIRLSLLEDPQHQLRIFSIVRDITERKRAEDDRRNITLHMLESEEKLKKQIAAEIHDEFGAIVTAMGINMALIREKLPVNAYKILMPNIDDSVNLVETIGHTTRNILKSLRPQGLDDFGLITALNYFANSYMQRTGIDVFMEVDETFPKLTSDKNIILFRVIQESLTNIAKHAEARRIEIALHENCGLIRCVVSDNGKGFNTSGFSEPKTGCGMGLKIMKERIDLIDGTFTIDSHPGKGTVVSIQFEDSKDAG